MTKAASDSGTFPSAKSDTVATPEGDNEFAPDQPLKPIPGGLNKPPAIDTNKL